MTKHKKINVIVKSKKFMYPYIAVHGLVPKNELPKRMRNIRRNSIYIRKDIVNRNRKRTKRILRHEIRERYLMSKGYKYKTAHKRAGYKYGG